MFISGAITNRLSFLTIMIIWSFCGYFLLCMRYIEMNPVRAKMIDHPAKYRWSSFAANALGEDNSILQCHEEYLGLGNCTGTRRQAYRKLFEMEVDEDETGLIQKALHSGTPVGSEKFLRDIENVTGNKTGQYRRGRPGKSQAMSTGKTYPLTRSTRPDKISPWPTRKITAR